MNEKYKFEDLIRMLQKQYHKDFQGIKVLIELLEDDSIPVRKKHWLLVAALRGMGLYETEVEITDVAQESPDEVKWEYRKITFAVEYIECTILNAEVIFQLILN